MYGIQWDELGIPQTTITPGTFTTVSVTSKKAGRISCIALDRLQCRARQRGAHSYCYAVIAGSQLVDDRQQNARRLLAF